VRDAEIIGVQDEQLRVRRIAEPLGDGAGGSTSAEATA
jgi:hypothetical protein